MNELPPSFEHDGVTFRFERTVGRGAEGAVGLYRSDPGRVLALKASHCGKPAGLAEATEQLQTALELAQTPCGAAALRAPLAYRWAPPCMHAVYDFVPENLEQWLAAHPARTPAVVTSLFRQLLTILDCLRAAGVHYTDLKPDNFLVRREADAPRLVIGDLGGLGRYGAAAVVVTPRRLPPSLLRATTWENIDVLTSYLVGVLVLELLLRSPAAGDAARPLDELFACLHRAGGDECTAAFLTRLRAALAEGLALEQPETLTLAALALNLTGYRGLFVSLGEVRSLPSLARALL